jgi:hypothetical protein
MHSIVLGNIQKANDEYFDICEQIPHAIERVDGDRCYVKPEKLVLLDGAVYVADESKRLVSFPIVCFSEEGVYLPMASRAPQPKPMWICAKCTWAHYYEPTICERSGCGSRDFIIRYR